MDIVYGIVGGLVLTWLAKQVIKNMWGAAVIGAVVTIIVLGIMPAGFTPTAAIAAVVGAVIGALIGKKK